MKKVTLLILVALGLGLGLLLVIPRCKGKKPIAYIPTIEKPEDIQQLFPASVAEINERVDAAITQAQQRVQALLALPENEYSFETVARGLDTLVSGLTITGAVLCNLSFLHPDEKIRTAANAGSLKLSEFSVDWIARNKDLYNLFKTYAEKIAPQEQLNAEERYFVDEMLKEYKKAGFELPDAQQEQIKKLFKELAALTIKFEENINTETRTIKATREQLDGLEEDFINNLKKDADGFYSLGMDYPTYFTVIKNAKNEDTRKRIVQEFNNRAYPQNEQVLKEIVQKRDELAKLLGYANYAELNIDDEMAETPQRVTAFVQDLMVKADKKDAQEFEQFKKELPEGVTLTDDGKFKPWDLGYVINQYKKKHLQIDDEKVAEYFPMEHTVEQLLDIYQQFFNLELKEVPAPLLWHPEVKLFEVYKKDAGFVGYLLLDLHPRPNKYSHACQIGTVPALRTKDDKRIAGVTVVIANFPKSTEKKPALLKHSDVKTFFHEFGHAIHSLLGATELASFSGTSVKTDFVEMPSQMLENWLYDPKILQKVSKHYKTGEPLPDELINKLIGLRRFGSGNDIQRQGYLSLFSLNLFKSGPTVDIQALQKELHNKIRKHVAYDDASHFYDSFGHLIGYGAKYYSYLWSEVFAFDLFEKIKKLGLLNPKIGAEYEAKVLSKGGSVDPNILLKDFLGREPNQKAFLQAMGFE